MNHRLTDFAKAALAMLLISATAGFAHGLSTKDSADFDWKYEWTAEGVYPDQIDIDGRAGGDFWDVNKTAGMETLAFSGYLQFLTLTKAENTQWQADGHNGYPGNVWPGRFTVAEGWTIEAAVQVVDQVGDVPVFMVYTGLPTDGGPQALLMIGKTGQAWHKSTQPPGTPLGDPVDNSDTYHVFRMVQLPGALTYQVWRDAVLVGDSLSPNAWGPYDRIGFGDCYREAAGTTKLDYLRFTAGAWAPPGYQPPGPGDANGDGKVDELDAAALAANWLRTGGATWEQGDFNGDGNVNDLDASILAANWLNSAGAAVPEPSTLLMWLGGVAAALAIRRRVPISRGAFPHEVTYIQHSSRAWGCWRVF